MGTIIARKIERNLSDYGLSVTLRKGLLYLTQAVYDHKIYRVYRIDLERVETRDIPDSEFKFKRIGPHDTPWIQQIEAMEEWLKGKMVSKLQKPGFCLVALDGDTVAGFNLIRFERVFLPLVDLERKLRDGVAWSEQITVNIDYRRRNLGTLLRNKVFNELIKRGYKRCYGATLALNKGNLQLTRKVGFDEIVDIHYRKILSWKKWQYKRVRR